MTLTNIDWTAIDWVSAGAYVLAAVLVLVMLFSLITSGTRGLIKAAKGNKDNGPVILAGLVALLASAMSIQAQWGFLGHNLGITDEWTKAAFVGVFDLAAIAAALLSREARVRNPGTFGADALIVWAVALLLGWLGSTEATSFEGEAARWAVPLVAALMWDRVIQRDVARAVALDKARMATVTGRITATIVRASRAIGRSIMRTLARLGLVQPDEDIAEIQHKRWRKRFIDAAAKAAAAKRRHALATNDEKARKHRAKAEEGFASVVAAGQRLGAVTGPADLERLLWEAQVVLNAADALDQADAESPWRTAGRPTNRTIDADVVDQPTEPVTDRPAVAIDHPQSTDLKPVDRPTDPVDRPTDPVDLAPTDRPTRSIEPTPTARPTNNPALVDQPTERAIEGEIIDRPTRPTGRRTKEENEDLIRQAFETFLADADTIKCPSQAKLAEAVDVSKSTVQAYCGRYNITSETQITKQLIAKLPAHNVGEHI